MRRLAVLAVLMSAAVPAISVTLLGVRELRELIVSARAAGDSDADTAHKVGRVPLKERLTEAALADIRAIGLGPKTAGVLELLADVSEFLPGVEAPGTAPLTPAEGEAVLAKAREFTANYIRNLPDFVCTRVIRRFDAAFVAGFDARSARRFYYGAILGALRLQDTISSEVSFYHGKESYAAQTVDGQAHEQPVSGVITWGEFGGLLGSLLVGGANPKTEWSRWEVIDGKRVAVFRYSVDRQHSRYTVTWCCYHDRRREISAGYRGELFIEPASGSVIRLTRQVALPVGFPMLTADTMVEYRPVVIGGNSYICPVKSVTLSWWKASAGYLVFSLSEVRFGSYHKFGATSTLVVSDAQPEAGLETTAPPKPAIATPATAAPRF